MNEFKTLNNNEWTASDTLVFDVKVDDVEKKYDVFFNIRTTTDYSYANLYFFLELVKPDMNVQVDTFQMILAEPNGKWVGKNSGTLIESSFQIAKNVPFPKAGDYQFRLVQAMQDITLGEVVDVGLKIVGAEN